MRVLETCRPLQIKPSGSGDENACISENNKTTALVLTFVHAKMILNIFSLYIK